MNKKIPVFAIAALAGAISQTAMAEVPSFNYMQFDYVVSGDTEVSEGGLSESFDLEQGSVCRAVSKSVTMSWSWGGICRWTMRMTWVLHWVTLIMPCLTT